MSLVYIASFVFIEFLETVDAKQCMTFDGNNYISFHCSIYEYCCGTRCCRSPAITFYQMWYFWLMVFLTILFCSGGGWWYRLRNQDTFITPSTQSHLTQTRPTIHPAQGPAIYTSSVPIPPLINHAQYPPPPPYYGPPPSYDTVVNQSNIINQSQNQNQLPRQN